MSARPRILVFGAGGRLGAALARAYEAEAQVQRCGRAEADLADPAAIARLVRAARPDVVINCAAVTNVDLCETERELARAVNAESPRQMARACTETGARLVHISTDYVFSGEARTPYAEDSVAAPLSWYGSTKLEGEEAVLEAGALHAVVRVSWVFGPDRDSFVDKALQAALRGEAVRAVADKWSSPTYTLDAADALRAFFTVAAPGGIYHLCNRGVCTWLEWAQAGIDAALASGLPVATTSVEPLRLADLTAMVAPRPVYSAMSCRKLESLLGRPLRPWAEAVADHVKRQADAGMLATG